MNCILVDFGDDALAEDLQTLLSATLKVMDFAAKSIWPTISAPGSSNTSLVSNVFTVLRSHVLSLVQWSC